MKEEGRRMKVCTMYNEPSTKYRAEGRMSGAKERTINYPENVI
jgi:hypothetical protein